MNLLQRSLIRYRRQRPVLPNGARLGMTTMTEIRVPVPMASCANSGIVYDFRYEIIYKHCSERSLPLFFSIVERSWFGCLPTEANLSDRMYSFKRDMNLVRHATHLHSLYVTRDACNSTKSPFWNHGNILRRFGELKEKVGSANKVSIWISHENVSIWINPSILLSDGYDELEGLYINWGM